MFVRSLVFLVGSVVAAAAFVPGVATRYLDATAKAPEAKVEQAALETGKNAARYTGNRSAVISADPSGHFTGLFAINGRKEEGMVDTGASMVAIRRRNASASPRRILISAMPSIRRTARRAPPMSASTASRSARCAWRMSAPWCSTTRRCRAR